MFNRWFLSVAVSSFLWVFVFGFPFYDFTDPETQVTTLTELGQWSNTSLAAWKAPTKYTAPFGGQLVHFMIQAYSDLNGNVLEYGIVAMYQTNTSYRAFLIGRTLIANKYYGYDAYTGIQLMFWDAVLAYTLVGAVPSFLNLDLAGSISFNSSLPNYNWISPIYCTLNGFPGQKAVLSLEAIPYNSQVLRYRITACQLNPSGTGCYLFADLPGALGNDGLDYAAFQIWTNIVYSACYYNGNLCWTDDLYCV